MSQRQTPSLVRYIPRHWCNFAHITISLLTNTGKVTPIPEYAFWICLFICNCICFLLKNIDHFQFKHKMWVDYLEKKHKLKIKMSGLSKVPNNPESSTYFQSYSDHLYFSFLIIFLIQKP